MTNKKPCCRITGGFFKNYQELVRTVSIPYQWKILNDWIPGAEKSGAVHNLKLAAKLAQGEYYGNSLTNSSALSRSLFRTKFIFFKNIAG